MTRRNNSRVAGFTFLLYIVAGISSMALKNRDPDNGLLVLLTLLTSLCALTLGVTLYALTRSQDPDLALLALTCRIIEAIPGEDGAIFFSVGSTIFAWLLLRGRMVPGVLGWLGVLASVLLVVVLPLQRAGAMGGPGSWASMLTWGIWFPMLIFEIWLAIYLIVRGAAEPGPAA
ncbi:MAG TPA: DUF4386 family protein [Candidatus Polarisedimenticolia bacterium]|nr:DUF4386 family protein [Candidatus Polarisedimenticolia bacterium]